MLEKVAAVGAGTCLDVLPLFVTVTKAETVLTHQVWRVPRTREKPDGGAALQPLRALGQRHHLRLGHAGHGRVVKAREPLVRAQVRFATPVPVQATVLALIDFMFQQSFEQPIRWPVLHVGLRAHLEATSCDHNGIAVRRSAR